MLRQESASYKGFRNPGIRLREPIVPSLESHRSDLIRDELYAIHMFDKAHLVMLVEQELIPREDGVRSLRELKKMEVEGLEDLRVLHGGGMHSGEQYLIRKLGEGVGGRMHLGRSSGDLGEVGTRIVARDGLLATLDAVHAFRRVLMGVAAEHVETVIPGYTHAQHAQPTTWGHMLLSWVAVLERDTERLLLAFDQMNRSPAGAAILTGSDFPLDRHRVAELLGFAEVEKNTFDAILSHDNLFTTLSALSILHMNLARWSDDLMLFNTSEFGMLDFPDRFCGTSSIMMQKKNAYAPQFIKGAAAETVGALMTSFLVEKDPTSVPILDRAVTRAAIKRSLAKVVRDLNWMSEFMPALDLNTELMRERAGAFWGQATEIAGALVREKGLPWRTAHQIIGILVRLCEDRNIAPKDVTPALIDEAAMLYQGQPLKLEAAALQEALDPERAVRRRTLYGGPAPTEVMARMKEYEACLADHAGKLEAAREPVTIGKKKLEQAVEALIG
ncbi:MAG: argininosuccinate lyase [Hyphomicrobiales bacterium]